ncbi:Glycosyltransferase involved in cell wall bisynthesis [Chitinophaga sp. CF118]|uniref:glycosyltransferase n=1 Tax=Chitinophaga sp. CF118 TaxID=1884367 RepID=UPI0008F32DF6|nr:glycosyltransferase [Chitinophaga sp. CF118]SFD47669.1 Glycosyltransferase involved in cell wall bisynthesis [Chitinophaga sp. CF118]
MSVQFLSKHSADKAESGSLLQITTGFDLILPCCNPPEDWVNTLVKHYREVQQIVPLVPLQLIVVNDGSTINFNTQHILQLKASIPGIIIVSYPVNKGKGHAVREGIKRATFELQICTDLDFPFGTAAIKEAYDQLLAGADVVAGERGNAYLELLPAKRRIITRLSRTINRLVLRLPVCDAQAGLKGFNGMGRSVLERTSIDGFLYDSEFIYKASRNTALRINPITISCRPGVSFSSFRTKLLLKELRNYLKILTNRK